MSTVWNNIKEIIDNIEPLLLVIIPTCFALYLKLKNKLETEKAKQVKRNNEKNQEKFKNWEHTESINVIKDIKTSCNYYRDLGHMDLVSYIQLENGTAATSKLCNMFLTCLAEDSRSSMIPKIISFVQRIPYSRLLELVDEAKDKLVIVNDFKASNINGKYQDVLDLLPSFESISSYIIAPVKDQQSNLIGYCLFLYIEPINDDNNKYDHLMTKFVASVETIFLKYNISRNSKKKELKLD